MATAMNVGAEMVGLRHERQRDHSARQDGKEHVHPPKGLGVSQRASCEQAPVLGGEDLQLSRRRFGGSLHLFVSRGYMHRSPFHLGDE